MSKVKWHRTLILGYLTTLLQLLKLSNEMGIYVASGGNLADTAMTVNVDLLFERLLGGRSEVNRDKCYL